MQTAEGPFPMETTYTWLALNDKATKMTLRNKGNPAGLFKIFTPFITAIMRRAITKDLINIKKIIERQAST